jgi:hypothetical protein
MSSNDLDEIRTKVQTGQLLTHEEEIRWKSYDPQYDPQKVSFNTMQTATAGAVGVATGLAMMMEHIGLTTRLGKLAFIFLSIETTLLSYLVLPVLDIKIKSGIGIVVPLFISVAFYSVYTKIYRTKILNILLSIAVSIIWAFTMNKYFPSFFSILRTTQNLIIASVSIVVISILMHLFIIRDYKRSERNKIGVFAADVDPGLLKKIWFVFTNIAISTLIFAILVTVPFGTSVFGISDGIATTMKAMTEGPMSAESAEYEGRIREEITLHYTSDNKKEVMELNTRGKDGTLSWDTWIIPEGKSAEDVFLDKTNRIQSKENLRLYKMMKADPKYGVGSNMTLTYTRNSDGTYDAASKY